MSSNTPELPEFACILLLLRGITILKNYKHQATEPKKVFCDASLEDYAESRANGPNASSSFKPHDGLRVTYAAASLFVPGNEVVAACQPIGQDPMICCEKSPSPDEHTRLALNTLSADKASNKEPAIVPDSPVDTEPPESDDSEVEPTTPISPTLDPSFVPHPLDLDDKEMGRIDRYLGYHFKYTKPREGVRGDITATANASEYQTKGDIWQAEAQNNHNFRVLPEGHSIWSLMKDNKTACLEL